MRIVFTDFGKIMFTGASMKRVMNPNPTGEPVDWTGEELSSNLGPRGHMLFHSVTQGIIRADSEMSTLLGGILNCEHGGEALCSLLGDDAAKCKEFFNYIGHFCWMASKISEAAVRHGVDIRKFQLNETNLGPVVKGEISDSFMEEFQKITSQKPKIVDGPRM